MSIPTRGLSLRFERTYNSLDSASDGPLGYGWTHNYNMSLLFDQDTVTLKAGKGSHLTFADNGDGSFTPGPGIRATLEMSGTNAYRLTQANQISYLFNDQGQLTTVEDENANRTTLEYNAGGHLARIAAPGGASSPRDIVLTYNVENRIASMSTGGYTTTFAYHPTRGELTSVTDRRGFTTDYTYEHRLDTDQHLAQEIADPNGNGLTMVYDSAGRVESQTDSQDNTVNYTYLEGATIVTDPRGSKTFYRYERGLLAAIVDPLSNQTSFTYDDQQNRTSVTDPLGRVTEFGWDSGSCQVSVITDTLDNVTVFSYDEYNNLLAQTDPLERTTAFAYDAHNNLTTISNTLGQASHFFYDEWGQMQQMVNAQAAKAVFEHNVYGDLISVRNALSDTSHLEYDLATGQVITAQDANEHFTWFDHDAAGNLISVVNHLDDKIRYVYGQAGELLSITDQRGYTTTYNYDRLYQLTTITDALTNTSHFAYDAVGNLTAITDALGYTATYA